MRMKTLASVSVIGLLNVSIAFAATVSKDFDQKVDFKRGGFIRIENVNGPVKIESWDSPVVQIEARIEVKAPSQKAAQDFMEKVKIIVDREEDELLIKPYYPKSGDSESLLGWVFGSKNPVVNVEFNLMIPDVSNLKVSAVNGTIDLASISGETDLNSVNGKIIADNLVGPINANTVNGSIHIVIADLNRSDNIRMETVNGSVRLTLPQDVQADVKISTVNGSITTDFPIEIRGKFGPKGAAGKINGGGAEIDLSTVNGSVTLEQLK